MMNRTEETRLLYTLLDAAEAEGRLSNPALAETWRTLKQRFDNARSEQECAALNALLDELDRSGAVAGTWIQARWHAIKARTAGSRASPTEPHSTGGGRPVTP